MRALLEHTFEVNRRQLRDKDTAGWYCSLRTDEYDHEHDGIQTNVKRGKNALGHVIGKDDKLGTVRRSHASDLTNSLNARKSQPILPTGFSAP